MTFRLTLRLTGTRPSVFAQTFPLCKLRRSTTNLSDASLCRQAAQALFSLERFHRQSTSDKERRQVESQAWRELQKLPDEATNSADIHDVTDILGAWCYFSRFWPMGMQGPGEATDSEQKEAAGATAGKDIDVPLLTRRPPTVRAPTADQAPPPRANPLDEMIEF